jgi:hypothetical protein
MRQSFSTSGSGKILARSFDRVLRQRPYSFPNVEPRGQTLMMAADFGGQHKGQYFDTYAFLVFDLDHNSRWLAGQRLFRQKMMPTARRMCFKAMNDKYRRQALVPFLTLADRINGWLVLFAVSKAGGSSRGLEARRSGAAPSHPALEHVPAVRAFVARTECSLGDRRGRSGCKRRSAYAAHERFCADLVEFARTRPRPPTMREHPPRRRKLGARRSGGDLRSCCWRILRGHDLNVQ